MRVDNAETELTMAVAAEVRAEMARQRVSQVALAERLGWIQQRLSRRMTGEVPFAVPELSAVADELGVPITKFLPEHAQRLAAP